MAAASTLQDFLVSVRYTVDGASQQSFLQGLARGALSAKGLAAELVLLTGALVKLSEALAQAGERLYWMSTRMGSSVESIRAVSFAMSNLGVSGEEAQEGLQRFSEWTARYGSAGTGFLKMLGVNATDATQRYLELGRVLRGMGGTVEFQHGTKEQQDMFARALVTAELFGIGYREMLAMTSGEMEKFIALQKEIYDAVGLTTERQDAAAKTSHEYMNAWRAIGLEFQALRDSFSASLLEKLLPILQRFFAVIREHLPAIKRLFDAAATAIGVFFNVLVGLVEVIGHVASGFGQMFDLLHSLAPELNIAKDVLIGFGLAMMRTPFGLWIAALTLIAGLLEDFAVYQAGGKSVIDWGMFEGWNVEIAGVKVNLAEIAISLAAIAASMVLLRGGATLGTILGGVAGSTLGGGAPGAKGAPAAGGRAGLIGPGIAVTAALVAAEYFWNKAKEAGWDPGAKEHSPVGWGEQAGAWFREHVLGLPPESLSPGDWFQKHILGNVIPSAHAETVPPSGGGGNAGALGAVPSGQTPPIVSELPGTLGDYGSRANNPGNMNYAAWEGASGRFQYADAHTGAMHTMAVFRSMQEGVAAGVKLMMRNQEKYGHTLAGALHGWAELGYVDKLGMDPNKPFDVAEVARDHPEILEQILEHQYKREGRSMSSGALNKEQIMQGIQLATRPGGAPAGAGSVASRQAGDGSGTNVTLNQHTTVQVAPGANAHETAQRVAGAQGRINETMVRNTANVLR